MTDTIQNLTNNLNNFLVVAREDITEKLKEVRSDDSGIDTIIKEINKLKTDYVSNKSKELKLQDLDFGDENKKVAQLRENCKEKGEIIVKLKTTVGDYKRVSKKIESDFVIKK